MTYCHSLDAYVFILAYCHFLAYCSSFSLFNNNRGPTMLVFFCAILDATQMVIEFG